VTAYDFASLWEAVRRPHQWLLVHFEPGLVGAGDGFRKALQASRATGARIAFCCHWYNEEVERDYADLVDVFVLHRKYEGSPKKGRLIPLGCPTYTKPPHAMLHTIRQRIGIADDELLLVTVGFLTEWKRLPELAEALAPYLKEGVRAHFQTPYPFNVEGSGAVEQEKRLRLVVDRYRHNLSLSTEFLVEGDLLDLVYASDLGFLYHGIDTRSVSAAAKQFVSARTPLVLTQSSHDADLSEGVVRSAGLDVRSFAATVAKTIGDSSLRQRLTNEMEDTYEYMSMDAVAHQYANMFREAL
jgi:glycosyltransferase involved in cell wall biosynthesis